jgi:hypothetical protein
MYIDQNDNPYFGDMQAGDREATAQEVAVWEESRSKSEVDAKLTKVREVREAMLNRMAGIAFVAQLGGDTATVEAFKTARLALLDITTGHPADPADVDAFIMLKYLAIRAVLPDSLTKAFAGVDL